MHKQDRGSNKIKRMPYFVDTYLLSFPSSDRYRRCCKIHLITDI